MRLSDEIKQAHPDIPWQTIKNTRNTYVHNYGNIDIELVWNVIAEDIPQLRAECLKIIESEK